MHACILDVVFVGFLSVTTKLINFSETNISKRVTPDFFRTLDLSVFSNLQGVLLLLFLACFLVCVSLLYVLTDYIVNLSCRLSSLLPLSWCCTHVRFWLSLFHVFSLGTKPTYISNLRPAPDWFSALIPALTPSGLTGSISSAWCWAREGTYHRKEPVTFLWPFPKFFFKDFLASHFFSATLLSTLKVGAHSNYCSNPQPSPVLHLTRFFCCRIKDLLY